MPESRWAFPGPPGRAALAISLLMTVCIGRVHANQNVVISELMYNAPGNDANGEFIEITNRGAQSIDLTGWRLGDGIQYIFPNGTTIAPGQYLVIAKTPATAATLYGIPTPLGPYEGRLSNSGERIELRNALDGLVCEVEYEVGPPWPTGGRGDGRSIELTDLARNANVGRHWLPSSRILGSPGAPNSPGLPPVTVVVNEFVARTSGLDWIELYNYGDTPVDLNGYYLTDNPRLPTKARISPSWSAGSTVIQPKGYWVSNELDWGTFALSASGEQIHLVAPDGVTWVNGYDFGNQPVNNASEGRYPDGGGTWYVMLSTSPGSANIKPPGRGVIISEIQYHPADDSETDLGSEYLEIHNRNPFAVDLSGWAFTRGIDYGFPAGTIIPGNGYLALAANPSLVQIVHGISGVLGPYGGRLSNFSDALELSDELGNPVDFVEYRDEGLWPEQPDGNGPSLEAINFDMDRRLPGAWRASLNNGTPGGPNSQLIANPPASIDLVQHAPLAPTANQSVTVTAMVGAGNLTDVTLFWKRDQDSTWTGSAPMLDNGLSGDGEAGDGVYGATIPPFTSGTTIEFYIQASATGGNRTFPDGVPNRTCLYIVQNAAPISNLEIFRLVLTDESHSSIVNDPNSDVLRDCTFIYGGRAYYNCGIRLRGGNRGGPKYSYKVHLTPGYRFRDMDQFNLNYERHDNTLLKDKVFYHLLDYMGLPSARTQLVHTRYRNTYGGVHFYAQAQDRQYLGEKFPEDSDGNLYKAVAPWITQAGGVNIAWGGDRSWFEKQTNQAANNWNDLDELHLITRPAFPAGQYEAEVRRVVDVVNFARSQAVLCVGALIDTPWHFHNQNYRLYRRFSDNRFIHLLYDFDDAYWPTMWDNAGPISTVFKDVERFLTWPSFNREYLHGVWRAVNSADGEFRESKILAEVAYYHQLIYNDVAADPVSGAGDRWTGFVNTQTQWNNWLGTRNSLLRGLLPAAPLAITTNNGQDVVTGSANLVLEGTVPLSAPRLEVAFADSSGEVSDADLQWLSSTQWRRSFTLVWRDNTFVARTLDDEGNEIQRVSINVHYTQGTPNEVHFVTGPLPAQLPYTVEFFDNSALAGIQAWHWDFGDGQFGSGPTPVHAYQRWGTYTVIMTVTTQEGQYSIQEEIAVGTPIRVDFDRDGDVDQDDFAFFQLCLTGPGVQQNDPACAPARLDADTDVDQVDLTLFLGCMTGANIPAEPDCP